MKFSDALIQIGGSYWAKQGLKRIYFTRLERWYGLEILETSLRGEVVLATLDGKQIDPVQARKLRSHLQTTTFWYDIQEAEFMLWGALSDTDFQRIVDRIKERALAVMKHEEE